jgi:hypothetical protein
MRRLRLVDISCIEYPSSQYSPALLAIRTLCMNTGSRTEEKHGEEQVDGSHGGFDLSSTKVDNVSKLGNRKGKYRSLDSGHGTSVNAHQGLIQSFT